MIMDGEIKLSPEAQQILMELQAYQQQMQTVLMQKESLGIQQSENEKALEELAKTTHDDVYKTVGPILIKSTKKDLITELKEKQETIDIRLKSMQKQETRIRDKLKEAQDRLEEILRGPSGKDDAS
jgi:prefoldin beta subunit